MEQGWDVETIRQEENQAWDSQSSDEESSEYDSRADMPIQPQDIELEDVDEFTREELGIVMDGLAKWPWTVYPNHLQQCLVAAAKIVKAGHEESSPDKRRLQTLFREAVPNVFEKCLDDKAIWKWNEDIHAHILEALLRLMDVVVLKAPQLLGENSEAEEVVVILLKALAMGFDKNCQYHIKHKEQNLLASDLKFPHGFATPIPGLPVKLKNGEWYCVARRAQVRQVDGCECTRCRPPDVYCWLSYCLNYFGQTTYGNGYSVLLSVLAKPEKLSPTVMEAVLQPVARAAEFLTDDAAALFMEPSRNVLQFVAENLERDVDTLSDKTRDGTFGALSLILKHLQALIGRSISVEEAESMVSGVQRRMVERMLGFPSFNKQLSAVREINKLLENSRAIASRDDGKSVETTIEWLEKNDILRHVLRSHLHHKQYVDQVEKIMKFLLVERRLSEEHLDAIWAATEKPDQFEAVKNNIFDLLADLAWSFSDEQLDSLFGRFERSQGRTTADIVKILQLVKKLARSDTKGNMAERLLELLWNMLHSGEAPTEVLESGALTEILGHYDSVQCASKTVYIQRCLDMIEAGKPVIPSLRLLREIVMLDQEEPMFQNDIPRQTRLQQLDNEHGLVALVVRSLDLYLDVAKKCPEDMLSGKVKGVSPLIDGVFTHEQHVGERLDFLLWVFQTGGIKLEWPLADKIWARLVENPVVAADRERGLLWFCEALGNKWPSLTTEAQAELLSQRLCTMDPASLTITAWRCFQRLFLWVNLDRKKLKHPRNDNSTVTVDLNLEGLHYTWKIALHTTVEDIVDECIHFLRDVHTCLAENLEADVVQIRQQFVNECLQHLSVAVVASGISVGGEVGSCSRGSEGDGDDKSSVKNMEIGEHEDGGVTTGPNDGEELVEGEASREGLRNNGELEASEKVPAIAQVERCLRLLKVFITKCEGRCPRKVPAHGASFQGRPLSIEINTANKQSAYFKVDVHSNEYLALLRQKVAKVMDCPVARVRLVYQGRELMQDWQVICQCGIQNGTTISASVNLIDRPSDPMDEQRLPGLLVSRKKEVYDILFKLLEVDDSGVRDGAESLLMLLPTHPDILNSFLSLSDIESQEEAKELLRIQFSARPRLFYVLQVVDGILMPVNRPTTTQTKKFRTDFLWSGGFKCLLSVFQPGALSESVDDRMRRGCYACALRLIRFLLVGEDATEFVEPDEEECPSTTCLIRADGSVVLNDTKDDDEDEVVVSMNETANGGIVVEPASATRSRGKIAEIRPDAADLAQVVTVFTNLAWATAMGNIAAMGNSAPMSTYMLRTDEQAIQNPRSLSLASDEDEETGQDLDDAYVCHQSFSLLTWCLLKHKDLLVSFFTTPSISQFIVDTVLHCQHQLLRLQAAEAFLKLSIERVGDGGNIAHKHVLLALIAAKQDADRQPRQCYPYWELLCRLLQNVREPEEVEMAQKQLVEEVKWLKAAPAAHDDKDRRLEGHLMLTKTLVEVLNCQSVGSKKEGGLIQLLIKEFLFPASMVLLSVEAKESAEGEKMDVLPYQALQFGLLKGPAEDDAVLQAKCGTRSSRNYAFQLLTALAKHNLENFKEILSLLQSIHFREDSINDWEYLPSFGRKSMGGYVGLKNAGATCYMNSVFQQLYMQPQVRRSVLACEECNDKEKVDSVFFQLQAMFGALLGSSLDHYVPLGFWQAYRDYDGLPINLREHQDAFEFFNRLYDSIDETLKAIHQEPTLTKIFGGCFAQQVICRGCPHRSEREEPFAAISVDVKNKRDLAESLESFVRGDLLEADNAYYCEECGKKVDALRRVCVKTLPHTLVIHLKRFDFDYETMQRLKLKDRFEFPIHLDMKPYTVEGLALREKAAAGLSQPQMHGLSQGYGGPRWQGKARPNNSAVSSHDVQMASPDHTQGSRDEPLEDTWSKRQMLERSIDRRNCSPGRLESSLEGDSSESSKVDGRIPDSNGSSAEAARQDADGTAAGSAGSEIPVKSDSYYQYDLVGVVIHSGTAFAGHYYSYIKERDGDHMLTPGDESAGGRWVAFDDKRVEPYDVNDLEKDCFGGKYTVEVYDNFLKTTSPQEFDRPNSAYMLLYERSPQAAADVGSPVDSLSATAGSGTKGSGEGGNSVQEAPAVSQRDQPVALPVSIHRIVWEENLRFIHENHVLDKDYFRFLRMLVECNLDFIIRSSAQNKQLILEQRARIDPRFGTDAAVISKIADQIATLSIELAIDFLCRVFLRTHSSLREDMMSWRTAVLKLLESNATACGSFQTKMLQRPHWLSQFLLKCPVEDVRMMFANLVVHSLQSSARFLNGKPMLHNISTGRNQDVLCVDQLINALIGILGEATSSTTFVTQQYFRIFYEYALLGQPQRHSLLVKRVIPQWVDFACRIGTAIAHKLDLAALHGTVAHLVRSCDTSKFYDMDDYVTDDAGDDGDVRALAVGANPYRAQGPLLGPIAFESFESVTKQKYLFLLVETASDQDEVVCLLEFLSWQSQRVSSDLLMITMSMLRRSNGPELRHILNMLHKLVVVEDSLKPHRQRAVLLGNEIFRPPLGILDMLVAKHLTYQKRYALVKFVIRLARTSSYPRTVLATKRQDWKRIVDWLQEEIVATPSHSPIAAAPPSNDDFGSPNYLRRTASLENTLTVARNLLNSMPLNSMPP